MPEFSQDLTSDKISVVTPQNTASGIPQFSTAEYAHLPGTDRCRICNNLIPGDYYRINDQLACVNCASQAQAGQPRDSHAAFLRGLLLGSGGALVGLILYSTVAIVTGWTIGYVALAVGWLVGKGMIKGSNGLGGRRYQIAAVALTYAAISIAAIPISISNSMKQDQDKAAQTATDNPFPGDGKAPAQSAPAPSAQPHISAMVGQLLLYGLASPFLEFNGGNFGSAAIGLFILFIGLRIAWTMTGARPLAVDGPYQQTTA